MLASLKVTFLAGTLEHGGAERQLFFITRALVQCGAAVRVLCFDKGEIWENRIQGLGIPVTWVGLHGSRLRRLARIINEMRTDRPHFLQSQHFFANSYVAIASRVLGLHDIGAMRNNGVTEYKESGRIGGWLNLKLPRMLAVNSRVGFEFAQKRGVPFERLFLLSNVVDTSAFPSRSYETPECLNIVSIGRLVPQKRFDRLLKAVGALKTQTKKRFSVTVVGDGPLRDALEKQAAELGLLPHIVRFAGAIEDITPLYKEADLCVLTSDFEGTPNVLLEAMAAGLPVIATKVGGVPGIVRDGYNGLLCEPDDSDKLVSALLTLTEQSDTRSQLGRQAKDFVERHHSVGQLPSLLKELYSAHSALALPQIGRIARATAGS